MGIWIGRSNVMQAAVAACATLLSIGAWAQRAPDAGSTLQQIQQGTAPPTSPAKPDPLHPATPVSSSPSTGPRVLVKQFRFSGNVHLSEEQLQKVVKAWVGRDLDFGELKRVALAVAETYRKAGWVVRVDLPAQDVTEGIVVLRIREATLGKVNAEPEFRACRRHDPGAAGRGRSPPCRGARSRPAVAQ
jgi:hemolysin activation/secretion protein